MFSPVKFDANRRGKKILNYPRDKVKASTVVERGGEESALCDPGSELLLGGSARVVRR